MNEIEVYVANLKSQRDTLEVAICKLTAENLAIKSENEQLKKLLWEQQQQQSPQAEAPAPKRVKRAADLSRGQE